MSQKLLRKLFLSVLVSIGAGPAAGADDERPLLPALTQPATDTRLPGKFVWADLFTSEIDGARRFYAETFGWEWRWISRRPAHRYGIFYSDGDAVAGVAERASKTGEPYARWIHYLSVVDVESAVADTAARGGRVLLGRRSVPDRGDLAVVADVEGAPFGVLH
jgi:predicted enzyme related to lactoylglutathione lyase